MKSLPANQPQAETCIPDCGAYYILKYAHNLERNLFSGPDRL
jgi:hypothetical protein